MVDGAVGLLNCYFPLFPLWSREFNFMQKVSLLFAISPLSIRFELINIKMHSHNHKYLLFYMQMHGKKKHCVGATMCMDAFIQSLFMLKSGPLQLPSSVRSIFSIKWFDAAN